MILFLVFLVIDYFYSVGVVLEVIVKVVVKVWVELLRGINYCVKWVWCEGVRIIRIIIFC